MGFALTGYKPVYGDNKACSGWSNNISSSWEHSKHIDISKHFAHKAIQNGHLRLVRIHESKQLVGIFTKSVRF